MKKGFATLGEFLVDLLAHQGETKFYQVFGNTFTKMPVILDKCWKVLIEHILDKYKHRLQKLGLLQTISYQLSV